MSADDEGLKPVVKDACGRVRTSDKLIVGTILALGFVVNLTLLLATTEVQFTEVDGKRRISVTSVASSRCPTWQRPEA